MGGARFFLGGRGGETEEGNASFLCYYFQLILSLETMKNCLKVTNLEFDLYAQSGISNSNWK